MNTLATNKPKVKTSKRDKLSHSFGGFGGNRYKGPRGKRFGGGPNKRRSVIKAIREQIKKERGSVHEDNFLTNTNLSCSVYLDTDNYTLAQDVYKAFTGLLRKEGFNKSSELPAQKGSWFKRFSIRTGKFLSQEEVAEKLKKIEHALELKHLDQPQAEIDEKTAAAMEKLYTLLKDVPNGVLTAGTLLLIKVTKENGEAVIISYKMSFQQYQHLQSNPTLMMQPKSILSSLEAHEKSVAQDQVLKLGASQ